MDTNRPDPAQLRNLLTSATREAQHYIERFAAEIECVNGLIELDKNEGGSWKKLIARAFDIVEGAAKKGDADSVREAVLDAEKVLSPVAKTAKSYTVYHVGHAHIDMNWMWSYPETVAITNDTFSTVLRLMEEYPAFHFTQSQASVYEIMEKYHPELLKRIAKRVREGRFEVAASHWVEGEKNTISGESLCRHILYTKRYMKKLFGLEPDEIKIDWSPDTFGHAWTIPTYLNRGGVTRYYCCRPGDAQSKPPAFRWRAPDGSEVIVYREITWYNYSMQCDFLPYLFHFVKNTGIRSWMNVYGVGDHGGGPTRRDIERILDMDSWPIFPNCKMSGSDPFYKDLENGASKLPVLNEELNFEFTGCYTSQSLIKKCTRFAENQLADAETAATLARVSAGVSYPAENLERAWRDTLFCHFHDILPGSGVHDTRTYAHGLFQNAAAASSMAETRALRTLAGLLDTSFAGMPENEKTPSVWVHSAIGAGVGLGSATGGISVAEQSQGKGLRPFAVFNNQGHTRHGLAFVTVWDNAPERGISGPELGKHIRFADGDFRVHSPKGKIIPCQRVDQGSYWSHDYVTLAFPIEPLEPFGYSAYVVEELDAGGNARAGMRNWVSPPPTPSTVRNIARQANNSIFFENEFIRAELDATRGLLLSLTEKKSGVEVVKPERPASKVEYALERHNGMTAWVKDAIIRTEAPLVKSCALSKNGPLLGRAEFALKFGESEFMLRYEIRAEDPNLYISLDGTWVERGSPEKGVPSLVISFPFALEKASAKYEIPFGAIERKQNAGEEVPAIRWALVTGNAGKKRAGCMLINDSKSGHSLLGNTLGVTLIRSSYEPDKIPEVGRHEIRFALRPCAGEMSTAEAMREGLALNQPFRVVGTDVHRGERPATGSFLRIEPENVLFQALKKAEDDDAIILRLIETAGKKTTAKIVLSEKLLGRVQEAVECDLLERPLAKSSAKFSGNTIQASVKAHGLTTIRIEMKK